MIDAHSETWLAVAAHCTARIEATRTQLEGRLDAADTEHERGRIAALRSVLALATPRTQSQDDR